MVGEHSTDPFKYRVRFLVLAILAVKPSHGYEIAKRIEEVTVGAMKPSPGSIYPVLHDLSREGMVREELVVEKGRARKIYTLTRRGMEDLLAQLNVFQEITGSIYAFAAEARRALEENLKGTLPGCVPRSMVESLERIKDSAEAYLKAIRESGRVCSE